MPSRYRAVADGIQAPSELGFSGNVSVRPLYYESGFGFVPGVGDSSDYFPLSLFTTQQSVVADTLINTAATWVDALEYAHSSRRGASPYDEQTAVHTITQGYFQPYSISNCILDSITAEDDLRPVSVPLCAAASYDPVPDHLQSLTHVINGVPVIDYPPLKRAELLNIDGSSSDYRTTWFELPSSIFNISGLGAAIVLPKQYSNSTDSPEIVVCNLNAGWGSSSINTTWDASGLSATSSLVALKADVPSIPPLSPPLPPDILNSRYRNTIDTAAFFLIPEYPQETIHIQKEWAEYLNPRISNMNTTVIDYLMKVLTGNKPAQYPDILAQYALGALLTNGLARVGADYQFQGDPRLTQGPNGVPVLDGTFWLSGKSDFFTVNQQEAESRNWTKLRVDSTIQGYAYNTRGSGAKTAIFFLLTYCAMALAYTVYAGLSGTSRVHLPFYPLTAHH